MAGELGCGEFTFTACPLNTCVGAIEGQFVVPCLEANERRLGVEEATRRERRGDPDDATVDFGDEVGLGAWGDGPLTADDEVELPRRCVNRSNGGNGSFGLDTRGRGSGRLEKGDADRRDD